MNIYNFMDSLIFPFFVLIFTVVIFVIFCLSSRDVKEFFYDFIPSFLRFVTIAIVVLFLIGMVMH